MNIENEQFFRGSLTTKGRKTGREHKVMLRGVFYNDKFYFSRHKPDGDWFQNVISNPNVTVECKGERIIGIARKVTDKQLEQKISLLKYPGEQRAKENRVAIEITPHEQW